jgi:hypothetical protein
VTAQPTPEALAAKVGKCLIVLDGSSFTADEFPTLDDAEEAHAALAALVARAAEADALRERLTRYEEPGWINSVQKVMEERARTEAAEADRDRLAARIPEVVSLIEQLLASEPVRRTEGQGIWNFDADYLRELGDDLRAAALRAGGESE